MAFLAEAFAFLLPEEGGASPFEFPMKGQPAFLSGWDCAADIRYHSGVHLSHQISFFSELPLSWPPCPYVHSLQCALCISAVTSPAALLMIFLCLPLTSHHLFLYYFLSIPHIFCPLLHAPAVSSFLFAPLPPLPLSTFSTIYVAKLNLSNIWFSGFRHL